jgi:hypothetical protein
VVRAAYVSVASGSLKESLDRFRESRAELGAAQAQLQSQQRDRAQAAEEVVLASQAALSKAASEQAALDSLRGRLTELLAAQRAEQQARAAAVAVPAATKPATQGLPVNGGLLSAITTAVAPAPAPAAPVPAAVASAPAAVLPPASPAAPANPAPSPTASGDGGAGGVWLQLRQCESGDDYQANTGNGFFGAYQFSQQTWTDLGFSGRPDLAPPATQDAAAQKLQAQSGWGQWPACSAALGLS